jgi:hypothetical protein
MISFSRNLPKYAQNNDQNQPVYSYGVDRFVNEKPHETYWNTESCGWRAENGGGQ